MAVVDFIPFRLGDVCNDVALTGSHCEEHRAKVGDQPYNPDQHAEFMEVLDRFFIIIPKNNKGPNSMNQHQENGDQARNTVYIKGHAAYKIEHQSCSPGITDQSENEKAQMPPF